MADSPSSSTSVLIEIWSGLLSFLMAIVLFFMNQREKDQVARWKENSEQHKEILLKCESSDNELWSKKVDVSILEVYLAAIKEDKAESAKRLESIERKVDIILKGHSRHRADDRED